MNKIFLLVIFIFLHFFQLNAQTTATDFDAGDCSGNPHHLFSELDSDKVVVIDFVMPCGSCLNPSRTVYNIINIFKTSYPGRILFYLSDGFGSHKCDTLIVWAANNHIDTNTIIISTASLTSLNYGTAGMPKIVVLGGQNHHIYFNQNDDASGDSLGLSMAIDSALHANDAVFENGINNFSLNLFPNPVRNKAKISYSLKEASDIKIEIYSADNEKLFSSINKKVTTGKHESEIDLEKYASGNYLLKISSGKGSSSYKFCIVR